MHPVIRAEKKAEGRKGEEGNESQPNEEDDEREITEARGFDSREFF